MAYKPTTALLWKRQYALNSEAGQWAEAFGTTAACLREAATLGSLQRGTPLGSQMMDGTS